MKKVGFVSLGCPKNLVDSEVMMGRLKDAGYEITDSEEDADTIVVNTCGFIESAKEESIAAILEATGQKENGSAKRVVVAGCMVERYRDQLIDEIPEADAFIGTNELERILEAVDEDVDFRARPLTEIGRKTATYLYDEYTPRLRATDSHTAFIKISEGCDRPCAFCSIPEMRGSFRSRRFGSIIREAQDLASQGVKEVVLIAQDSSRYGEDLGEIDGLAHLLNELSRIDDLTWIRVMYTYPTHISDAFLEAVQKNKKAVKYLDMPLQHASRNVLKLMKRGGNRESLTRLIERVRERVPGISIRTTFIVGFPGETEEDFEELKGFIKDCGFENVGVFTYSDEEGTPAFELPDKVSAEVAERRRDELMALQALISREINESRIDSEFDVMFEGVSDESELLWKGRLEGQAQEIDGQVLINDAPEDFLPVRGKLVRVRITEAFDYDLVGEIVGEAE
ncbi:MAG: 30S ribosomal protein S12 methylthiotransferase RimO [Pyrinomonadaceae bacterium]